LIARIQLDLTTKSDIKLGNYLGSLFQGVLMELISPEYADELHISSLHPYSQYVRKTEKGLTWTVNTLDSNSRSQIIGALSNINLTDLTLRQKEAAFHISGRKIEETTYDDLLNRYYMGEPCPPYVSIDFLTPTSFKSNGKYVIFPTSQLILKSLAKKYDNSSTCSKVCDELLFDYINENTEIIEYSLRSTKFSMEGITIPSFIGSVKLKCTGNRKFRSLVNMLLKFGEYSGAGIKNSMGMGAIKVRDQGGNNNG